MGWNLGPGVLWTLRGVEQSLSLLGVLVKVLPRESGTFR